jgi:hypothetical protein
MDEKQRYEAGMKVRREVLGDANVVHLNYLKAGRAVNWRPAFFRLVTATTEGS